MQKTFIFDNVLCLSKEIKDMLIVKLNCRVFHLYAKKTLSKVFWHKEHTYVELYLRSIEVYFKMMEINYHKIDKLFSKTHFNPSDFSFLEDCKTGIKYLFLIHET